MEADAFPPGLDLARSASPAEGLRGKHLAELARVAEGAEGGAFADSHAALPAGFAGRHGFKIERAGSGHAIILPSVDEIFFNRVFGLGLEEPITERLLDGLVERYRKEGVRRFAAQLSPAARPGHATDWLAARGFRFTGNWAKVYRGTEPPPEIPTTLAVREIGPEHASDFARIVRSGFPEIPRPLSPWLESLIGRPGWRHFMAFSEGKPVATGSLFVHGEVGWIDFGSTLPLYRRLGAQGALLVRRIREAIVSGCRLLISEAEEDLPDRPNPSYHNLVRTGFRLAYLRPNYIIEL